LEIDDPSDLHLSSVKWNMRNTNGT
jgi:hypothetical protein